MRITITAKKPIDPSYDSTDELELVFELLDDGNWKPISIRNAHVDADAITPVLPEDQP